MKKLTLIVMVIIAFITKESYAQKSTGVGQIRVMKIKVLPKNVDGSIALKNKKDFQFEVVLFKGANGKKPGDTVQVKYSYVGGDRPDSDWTHMYHQPEKPFRVDNYTDGGAWSYENYKGIIVSIRKLTPGEKMYMKNE